ncbi:hypothetical protein FRB98_008306 [Tulasnella sp. 332]|nr:hypothetical protein FRB98_008306 [Tulasnella sp. 332]
MLSTRDLCEPHFFSLGDTFQTTLGTFAWNLDFLTAAGSTSPDNSTAQAFNNQGLNYTGLPLLPETCIISSLRVSADLPSWTATAIATIWCNGDSSFPVGASTSFVSSAFLDKSSLGANRFLAPLPADADFEVQNRWGAQVLLEIAGLDILTTLRMNLDPLDTSVTSFSVHWSRSLLDPQVCYAGYLPLEIDTIGLSNTTLSQSVAAENYFNTTLWNTTSNFLQTMMAAVNLDIGSPCPSFLTQPTTAPDVLYSTPDLGDDTALNYYQTPLTSHRSFIHTVNSGNAYLLMNYGFTFPLYAIDDVYIESSYLCHLSVRKGIASLVIAIVSGTYTVFNSGWGAIMIVAIWYASKPKECMYLQYLIVSISQSLGESDLLQYRGVMLAKYCAGHAALLREWEMIRPSRPSAHPRGELDPESFELTPGDTQTSEYLPSSPGGAPTSGYIPLVPTITQHQSDIQGIERTDIEQV